MEIILYICAVIICQVVTDNEFFPIPLLSLFFIFSRLAQSYHSSLKHLLFCHYKLSNVLFNQLSFITLLISHFLILRSGVPLYLSLDFTYSFPRVSVSFSLMISFSKDLKGLDSNSSYLCFSVPLKLINYYYYFFCHNPQWVSQLPDQG